MDLCSKVVGDSSRHRVTRLTGWLMVQSAAGALMEVKRNKISKRDKHAREKTTIDKKPTWAPAIPLLSLGA